MADDLFGDSFRDEIGDVSRELERIGDLANGVARSISSAFRGALLDGKSFKSLLGDIARSFADIALKAAIKPFGDLVGGLVGNLFAGTNPALGTVTPFAKGGVIARPSYFPLGGGLGLDSGFGRKQRGHKVASAELAGYVERVVRGYVQQRGPGERFAQWVLRVDEGAMR